MPEQPPHFDAISREFDRLPDYATLFAKTRDIMPRSLQCAWFIPVLSSLVTGRFPSTAASALYQFLLAQEPTAFDTTTKRASLHRRLREILVHMVPIVGLPRVLAAGLTLTHAIPPSERDDTFSRAQWSPEASRIRGSAWLRSVYAQESDYEKNLEVLSVDPTLHWLTTDVCYGLFLSDHSEINGLESELVVASSLMTQGLPRHSIIHMKALRHIGISAEELACVQRVVRETVAFMGSESAMDFMPSLADVEWPESAEKGAVPNETQQ